MRTTVDLPDDLLAELKRQAASSRRTLRAVIEDAVRQALNRNRKGGGTGRIPPPQLATFGGSGLQPGVDLDDSAALLDVMG